MHTTHPTLCQFNTIHYSQLMYLTPVFLLFSGLLFSLPYCTLPSHYPAKFCTTSQLYPSNLFHPYSHFVKVPTSCYKSLVSHVFSYIPLAQQLNILASLSESDWRKSRTPCKSTKQHFSNIFCLLSKQKKPDDQKQLCSCTNVSPQAWDCACPSDLPLHQHTSVPLMDLPAIQWNVTHNTRNTEHQTMNNKTSEH
jgi:hypothetical protein